MIETPIRVKADLDKGIRKTYLDMLFVTKDKEAHRFEIEVVRGNSSVTLSGKVNAYFIRYCDNLTIPMDGTLSGNVAKVTLKESCYERNTQFALIVKVSSGSETGAVFYGEGAMLVGETDAFIDEDKVVPSLSELLAQIDEMERATANASTATENATAAAQNANEAARTANNSAQAALMAATFSPRIGDNGNWFVFQGEAQGYAISGTYVDTGVSAAGTGGGTGSVEVDTTLTKSGMAADAKAAGDAIKSLNSTLTNYATKSELESAVDNVEVIPSYWQEHLDSRILDIRAAMAQAGFKKSAFLWYHDAHWTYNYQKSPMLLKYLYRNTTINRTFFGGDIVDNESDDTTMMYYLHDWRNAIRDLPNHHSVVGNHDDGNSIDNRFDDPYIYSFLLAAEETPDIVRGESGLYYYMDSPAEKTRYLFLDTASRDGNMAIDTTQQAWFREALKSTPDSWHIVVVSHIWRRVDYSVTPPADGGAWAWEAEYCVNQLDLFNARQGEYAGCTAKVEFCIGGHSHVDSDFYTDGGILVILTETDSRNVRSGLSCTKGTISEASVNAIVADYANGKVNVIRIGRGSSRVAALTKGDDVGGDTGGDTGDTGDTEGETGVYTNVLPSAIGTDGNVYNGTGYKENVRISATNGYAESTEGGWDATGYIPAKVGDVIRMANITSYKSDGEDDFYRNGVYFYDSSMAGLSYTGGQTLESPMSGNKLNAVHDSSGQLIQFDVPPWPEENGGTVAYIRIVAANIDQNSIITVNQKIS